MPSSLSDLKGEIDIKWFEYVREVKPGYRQENFTKSLKKYIPGYDPNNPSAANGSRKPGYMMKNSPSAKLLNVQTTGGYFELSIVVESLGLGKIGYFFENSCGKRVEAKEFVTEFVAEVNAAKYNTALIATAGLVVATIIEDVLSGGAGIVDDAPAFAALGYNASLALQKLYELFP